MSVVNSLEKLLAKQKAKMKLAKNVLPKLVAVNTLRFFERNYDKGGARERVFSPWTPRKKDTGKPLLVDSGNLRASLKIASMTLDKISIKATDYKAKFHQFGTNHLPQRKILYRSLPLEKENNRLIKKTINDIFN